MTMGRSSGHSRTRCDALTLGPNLFERGAGADIDPVPTQGHAVVVFVVFHAIADTGFGPQFERLSSLKAKYGQDNLFSLNQNIKPVP